MKILFIGGTGNISLSVSRQLLVLGHELWLLNRSGEHDELPKAHFIRHDIHQLTAAAQLSQHHWDVVVNWIAFSPADVERDYHLFRHKTRQYIFISSASCYQKPTSELFITECTPLHNPYWPYSRNKIAAEEWLRQKSETEDFPVTIVRPSHTYDRVIPLSIGGWQEYTTVARMKQQKSVVVHGDGHTFWTLTHASDFAVGFIGLLGHPQALNDDFHITSDEHLTWNQIYQLTAQAIGQEARIVHVTSDKICALDEDYTGTLLGDKSENALFDNSKIKRLVPHFDPKIRFQEGIAATLAWFEADPSRQRINPETDAFIERLIHYTQAQS